MTSATSRWDKYGYLDGSLGSPSGFCTVITNIYALLITLSRKPSFPSSTISLSSLSAGEWSADQRKPFCEDLTTMRHRIAMSVVAVAVLAIVSTAGDALKSGPQAGQPLGGPFNVLNVTGKNAGKSNCLV
jgi:hypothetical protein